MECDKKYKNALKNWKKDVESVKQRNHIRSFKNNKVNEAALLLHKEYNAGIENYNIMGSKICENVAKIFAPKDLQFEIEIEGGGVIIFEDEKFKDLADIVLDEKNVLFLEKILHENVIKVKVLDGEFFDFVNVGDWGLVSIFNGKQYMNLEVEIVDKFKKIQFQPKPLKRFIKKTIKLEVLPSKPEKQSIKMYEHKPLPSKPMETYVAIPSTESAFYKLNFGTW